MASFNQVKVMREPCKYRRFRRLQRKPKLCIELLERRQQHGMNFGADQLGLLQALAQASKGLSISLLDA